MTCIPLYHKGAKDLQYWTPSNTVFPTRGVMQEQSQRTKERAVTNYPGKRVTVARTTYILDQEYILNIQDLLDINIPNITRTEELDI